MAERGAQARAYRRPDEEAYAPEEENDHSALPTPDLDNALRLAHHAQRLKALEIGMENFSRGMTGHIGEQRKIQRRQLLISFAVGGVCLLATLISGIVIGGAVSRIRPPAAIVAAVPVQQPVAQVQMPAPVMQQPVAMQPQVYVPPQTIQPVQQYDEPVLEMPTPVKPVAMGRYDDLVKPKPGRTVSAFENAINLRLSASNQTMPASWMPIVAREATGDSKAKLQIAAKFLKGEGVKTDNAFALTLIRQAATSGNKEAMMWLAYSYDAGNMGKPDPVAAAKWFSEAAKAGVTGAYAELGRLYEKGVDGAPDPETALSWYQRAANAGDAKAAEAVQRLNRSQLSQNVLLSAEPPVQKPPQPILQPAAANGYNNARAMPVAATIPAPPAQPPMADGQDAERSADIRAAQRMLKVLGYKIDTADGMLGPQTQTAIRSYQRDHAAYPDGQFTPALLESLTRDIRFGR